MRRTCLIGVVAVAVIAGRLDAKSPPDFSGKWVFVSSQPAGTRALGGDFSIAQDATTLKIDYTAVHYDGQTTGGWTVTPVPTRTVYVLDGIEHPIQVIANQPTTSASASTLRSTMSSTTEESVSKATWAGQQLVIMTYSKIKFAAPRLTPPVSEVRQTVRRSFSMQADGTLSVESLTVADPLPWGSEAPSPTSVRSFYKKG